MDRQQQKDFVTGVSARIAEEICEQIDKGLIPEEWDGHELRALLEYRHKMSADMSVINRAKNGKRARDFKNTVITNNL